MVMEAAGGGSGGGKTSLRRRKGGEGGKCIRKGFSKGVGGGDGKSVRRLIGSDWRGVTKDLCELRDSIRETIMKISAGVAARTVKTAMLLPARLSASRRANQTNDIRRNLRLRYPKDPAQHHE
ncbi:uncharacterized protein LOC113470227 [Gryllus bimaculatus]|nr:uncharacterized protein LOC113470227 [Gryllus bimaculatus]